MSEQASTFSDRMKSAMRGEAPADSPTTPEPFAIIAGTSHPIAFAIFAVSIPLVAIALGASGDFLNIVPTAWHVAAALVAPLSLLIIELVCASLSTAPSPSLSRWMLFANGAAIMASALYSIALLPIAPFAAVAALFVIGLIPLAPFFTLSSSLAQGARLRRALQAYRSPIASTRWRVSGAAAVLVPVALATMGPYFVDKAAQLAMSEDPDDHARAVSMIRWTFAEQEVLERCYGGDSRRMVSGPIFSELPRGDAPLEGYRRLYFMVTGKAFNSVPAPSTASGNARSWGREAQIDREVGSDDVAGRIDGLALVTSTIKIDVDPEMPVVATMDWTFTFHNASNRVREARTKISIPPGAVASDLSLWINGEERPAAFGTRSQVKRAYRDVAVVRRKDPALLTTAGPDRLMLQCFPIPPRGQMKTRIRLTAPFVGIESVARLRLPRFTERNFGLATGLQHSVTYDAPDRPVVFPVDVDFRPTDGEDGVRGVGALGDAALATASFEIPAPSVDREWHRRTDGFAVAARWTEPKLDAADALVFVVDEPALAHAKDVDWAQVLRALPPEARVKAVRVGLKRNTWRETWTPLDASTRDDLAAWLSRDAETGGCDAVPALVDALDDVKREAGGIVVWLHGPAAVRLTAPEVLQPRLSAAPRTRLFTIASQPGPNHVIDSLEQCPNWAPVATFGNIDEAVTRVLSDGRAARAHLAVAPSQKPRAGNTALGDPLLLLGMTTAVHRHLARAKPADVKQAKRLATGARLVTPVSGAVVLETKEQYARHGLDPNTGTGTDDTGTVPAVPEPETWAMIIVALCALFVFWRRRA